MTLLLAPRSGPVPALMPGTTDLGRGERETRGEHRGRGERLPSGSRFVFMVPGVVLLALLLALPRAASAQDGAEPGGFTIGLRGSGIYSTRLIADDIGFSILPDTTDLIEDRFDRDTVTVSMGIAPDLTLVGGYSLNEQTTLQLAIGYTFGQMQVNHAEASRDAGGVAVGHAVFSVQKPVGGFLGRVGAGALWVQGGELTALEDVRALNPLLEVGIGRRWPLRGLDLDAGVAAQATQLTSDAIEARGGQPGFVYRVALELGLSRRFAR